MDILATPMITPLLFVTKVGWFSLVFEYHFASLFVYIYAAYLLFGVRCFFVSFALFSRTCPTQICMVAFTQAIYGQPASEVNDLIRSLEVSKKFRIECFRGNDGGRGALSSNRCFAISENNISLLYARCRRLEIG